MLLAQKKHAPRPGDSQSGAHALAARLAIVVCLAVAPIGSLAAATPASAIETPSPRDIPDAETAPDRVAHVSVSPLEVLPGGAVRVSGECTVNGRAATSVLVRLSSRETEESFSLEAPIDAASGIIDADINLPVDMRPGRYLFGWLCSLGDMGFGTSYGTDEEAVYVTVLDPGTAAPESTSPAPPVEAPTPPRSEEAVVPNAQQGHSTDELAATGSAGSIVVGGAVAAAFSLAGGGVLLVRRARARGTGDAA